MANPQRTERFRWHATHVFFTTVCLIAGCMFFFKLHEFLRTIKKDELAGFAFDPILTYGFVALGFFFLLVWAFLTGQFKDIEKTKHEMIERVLQQERDEGLQIREEIL
ncbi:MAG: hypothetical protein JNN27_22125 [Planctomycetes bacterium]|jgi:nitrogen fixation-related uncharacterized protein|nr:hypothetical protein [Planctomycetota bacterium]